MTFSGVISRMQSWVCIEHEPLLQPMQGRSFILRTRCMFPRGDQRSFTEGPMKETVGIPRAHAT